MNSPSLKPNIKLSFEILPLATYHPFGISYGTTTNSDNVLVCLSYDGIEGLGEAAPASYHNETISTVMSCLKEWQAKHLLGFDPFAIEDILQRLEASTSGNYSAKAAIEMALHDLCGKILQAPTYKMLGLAKLKSPMTDFTIGLDSLEVIESKTKEAINKGYKILKVKQGTSYDKEIIQTIRKVAPELPLRVDANGSWTPKQTIVMSKFLSQHNVEFIEQPLPKLSPVNDWRFVRENSCLPIFADESCCRSLDVVRLFGAVDGIVVKLAKTGGLLEALKVIHTARACHMKIMLGCMIESSLGVTAATHLSPLVDYLDLDGALLLANDPFCGARYCDGYMVVNDQPGLGVSRQH